MATPMKADPTTSVLVPMRLTAFCNYGANRLQQTDPQYQAYLAAIPSIKVDQLDTVNDIYESVRDAPLAASADPTRKAPEREGIYLHWEIPSYYKTATAYSSSTNVGTNMAVPEFPAVPDRYIVIRTVTSPTSTNTGTWGKQSDPDDACISVPPSDANLPNQTVDVFFVDSSLIRQIPDLEGSGVGPNNFPTNPFEDAEVTCSPFIDPGDNPADPPTTAFLGRTTRAALSVTYENAIRRAAPLTVHSTANPFFADFQPYNASVFSMFDRLDSLTDSSIVVREGLISYTVVGWHSDQSLDPLSSSVSSSNLMDALKQCKWALNTDNLDISSLADVKQASTICHGSLLNIHWTTLSGNPSQMKNPADNFQANVWQNQPFAVGSNAIDALLGWIDGTGSNDPAVQNVKPQLRKLQSWVMDVNDNLDSQLQAQDLLSTNNFAPVQSGNVWQFEISENPAPNISVLPQANDINQLQTINYQMQQSSAITRELAYRKQQLFDAWWTFKTSSGDQNTSLQQQIQTIKTRITTLNKVQLALGSLTPNLSHTTRSVPDHPFYQQREPTLLVAGMGSRWLNPESNTTTVRLDGQDALVSWLNEANSGSTWTFDQTKYPASYPLQSYHTMFQGGNFLPATSGVEVAIMRLLAEGVSNAGSTNSSSPVPSAYFGIADRHDSWNGWFPLYVEWEGEYYDIPFQYWEFQPYGPESRWGYAIGNSVSLPSINSEARILSGRAPIVPQTAKMLSNVLQQVFSRMNPDTLENIVAADDRANFLAEVSQLDYLSTTLSGFTDQLLLRQQGAHVLPFSTGNLGSRAVPVVSQTELTSAQVVGLDLDDFEMMFDQSGTVKMTKLFAAESNATVAPLTHGQFRFTRLNIVDRWAQVVHAVRWDNNLPQLSIESNDSYMFPTALFPALGEEYSVGTLAATPTIANTVMPREDSNNSFVQLPPCLNQHARVNFEFLQTSDKGGWRPSQPHENPVIAYIVFNTANESLQLFTDKGLFMCEFLVRSGTIATRPFSKNELLFAANQNTSLQQFVTALQTSTYVSALYQNIEQTVSNVQSEPGHSAETMQAILGRPLALVAFNASIELATIPDPGNVTDKVTLTEKLLLKFGDRDNVFDGLYCLFESDEMQSIDFSTMYSYADANNPISPIAFQPFWLDPTAGNYIDNVRNNYTVFGALVDPFTAIHAYSAILPIKQLKVPEWAISRGLNQISSFFHVGPVVVASDVPAADPDNFLLTISDATELPPEIGSIAMPALGYANWAWMQPTLDSSLSTSYNICGIEQQPSGPQYDEGPRTATEGYLLMRKPFGWPDPLGSNP